jgi:tRNA dimethylallyltransferase
VFRPSYGNPGAIPSTAKRPSLVIICGPTASGKSRLGLHLADALEGEIVSADSMQVYIYMDIGTDKASAEIRRRIPHHAIDLVYPDEAFNAALYRQAAFRAIEAITLCGKRVFVVGGTGLYLRALIHGLFPCPPIPEDARMRLRQEATHKGIAHLYEELRRVDSMAARRIHPNDSFRILRALEVYRVTGRRISELQQSHRGAQGSYRVLKIAIETERNTLYRRIEARVDRMMAGGFVEEVERLFNLGYSRDLKPMQSIGYRQVGAYLYGELSLDQTIQSIKRDSRRYAKRQWTWFRGDSEVCWVNDQGGAEEAFRMVKNFLKV